MYTTICERLGLQPMEVLYIDDMAAYCSAAENIGMQAVQYINYEQCQRDIESSIKD